MFTRVGRFFKAIFNAILGEAEAQVPVSMLEQSVREMLDNLRVLREATATTIAFETKGKREFDAQNARVKNLDSQAEEALRQGNEKLARRALQLQVEAKATRDRSEQVYKAAKLRADNARTKLKVEQVFPTDAECSVIDLGLGIRPEDRVRAVFPMPIFTPRGA